MAFMIPIAMKVGSFALANAMSIASMAAAGISAYGGMKSAEAQQQAAYDNAAQLDARAGQERAISHLEMARKARTDKAQLSEQRNSNANSGFASDDASSAHLISETVGEQTLQQMLIKAQAEESAGQMEAQGRQMRRDGRNQAKATQASTLAAFAGDAISWHDRYGASRRNGSARAPAPKKRAPTTQSGTKVRAG
jgi:hypothetical protein